MISPSTDDREVNERAHPIKPTPQHPMEMAIDQSGPQALSVQRLTGANADRRSECGKMK
jgi:hypothetical protein